MANWDELNKEFDGVLEKISDQDWNNWAENRERKKAMRRQLLELKAKIHSIKLSLDKNITNPICKPVEKIEFSYTSVKFDYKTFRKIATKASKGNNIPIAA